MNTSGSYTEQRARFELLGGIGAAVLGAGVALLFRHLLAPLALPLLIVGLAIHGWAMWGKHRLDVAGQSSMPPWTRWAYWGCWALLAGLILYLVLRERLPPLGLRSERAFLYRPYPAATFPQSQPRP